MGGIGAIHARVYSQNNEARLVAVCDLLPERAEGAAQRFGVTAYRDTGEMLSDAKEQGVLLGVNLNHRFTPIADRAKKLIAEGALGEILFVNMALWINNPNESSLWFQL